MEKENRLQCQFSDIPTGDLFKEGDNKIKPEDQASVNVFYSRELKPKESQEDDAGLLPLKGKDKEAFLALRNLYNSLDAVTYIIV